MRATNLMTQNLKCPLGLEGKAPAFSWQLTSSLRGDAQTAWQILAASSQELLMRDQADLWNSGKISGNQNTGLIYEGEKLQSRMEVYWKVRVWDKNMKASEWSEVSWFEMGLLEEKDWKGYWIGRGDEFSGNKSSSPAIIGFFDAEKNNVKKARAYISGMGIFQASVNGMPVSENLYEPGESEFSRRVYYAVYDITPFLRNGKNVLGILLGNGQYANFAVDPVMKTGNGILSEKHRYQKDDTIYLKDGICGDVKLLAQVELTMRDGSVIAAASSGEDWRIKESFITFQNWYGGEDYDGTLALKMKGWDTPDIDHSDWKKALKMCPPKGKLSAKEFLPIRICERWKPESVTRLPGGNWLVDTGKNSAGFLTLKLKNTQGLAGKKIELYPAEVLKADGSGVDQASCTQSCNTLYDCSVKDSYVIAGTGTEEWHPVFCYHGFQYVEVSGFPGVPEEDNFEACAVRLINEKYSDFETDNEILNRIDKITDRSIESNMMNSFTDCPQIEKLGWLETTQLMFSSMAAGYDIRSWIPKIMRDMEDAQVTERSLKEKPLERDEKKYPGFPFRRLQNTETETVGFVPAIAPEYFRIGELFKDPNWGGACIMTPWYYYLEYGDENILRKNYNMMQAYIKHLEGQAVNGVLKGYAHMGEWGQLNENTPATLVATCAFYLQAVTMARITEILGDSDKTAKYEALSACIRNGFYLDEECYQNSGFLGNGSQASFGCALFSGILKEKDRKKALEGLVKAVEARGDHLSSGEVGLKQVFHALASEGKNDVVYRMVMNKTEPSYRHHIDRGLTTLPEFWNYTELWNGLGRSRNHAMMGHVKEWLYRFVLGIRPLEPGYRSILIKPWLHEGISRVKGSVFTVHGKVQVDCIKEGERIRMRTVIPTGTKADIWIPCGRSKRCLLDGEEYLFCMETEDGYLKAENILSGEYFWEVL